MVDINMKQGVNNFRKKHQDYDPNWVLINGALSPTRALGIIGAYPHFEADGYMNAWLVDRTGTYSLTIYYRPDIYAELGAIISCIAILMLSVFMLAESRKRAVR